MDEVRIIWNILPVEMEDVVGADLPELIRIGNEISSKCGEVGDLVHSLREKVTSSDVSRERGLSLLELKHQLMLSYVINLVELMLIKVEGQSLVDHPVVARLTEIRTVMEKIRPIDHKLRYQVDKLIRTATTGLSASSAGDPLHFRPRPSELISKLKDDEGDNEGSALSDSDLDEGEDGIGKREQLYVPPRVVAVPYDDDNKESRRSKHKRSRGSVLQELKDELSDAPLELKTSEVGLRRKRDMEEERERERFEEDQMNRVARKRTKRSGRGISDSLNEVTDFSGLETLLDDDDVEESLGRPSKRSKTSKKKGAKKRRFRRRK